MNDKHHKRAITAIRELYLLKGIAFSNKFDVEFICLLLGITIKFYNTLIDEFQVKVDETARKLIENYKL
ncbi:MAG: hypothetical protein ACFFG0_38555 [Candidatus Thorarchaeota archaeon]